MTLQLAPSFPVYTILTFQCQKYISASPGLPVSTGKLCVFCVSVLITGPQQSEHICCCRYFSLYFRTIWSSADLFRYLVYFLHYSGGLKNMKKRAGLCPLVSCHVFSSIKCLGHECALLSIWEHSCVFMSSTNNFYIS